MIAQLKYGSGTLSYRLEKMERQLGIPLPAATQWEVVEEAAELVKPARDELIRQAAQGEVVAVCVERLPWWPISIRKQHGLDESERISR